MPGPTRCAPPLVSVPCATGHVRGLTWRRRFQKHPVRYTPSELKEFITAFDLFPGDEALVDRMAEEGGEQQQARPGAAGGLTRGKVTGKMFIKMDEVDLIDRYGFKVGPAKSFLANSRTFQAPKVPIPVSTCGRRARRSGGLT